MEDVPLTDVDDGQHERGQDENVHQDVYEESEEGVRISSHPPRNIKPGAGPNLALSHAGPL